MSSIPSWKNRSTERVPSFFYCKMIDLFLPQIVKLMESHMGHTKDLGHFPHQSAYRKIMSQLLVTSLYSITKSVPDPFFYSTEFLLATQWKEHMERRWKLK